MCVCVCVCVYVCVCVCVCVCSKENDNITCNMLSKKRKLRTFNLILRQKDLYKFNFF